VKVDLDVAQKLLALATNHAASEEERRTAAMIVADWLHAEKVLPRFEKLSAAHDRPPILGAKREQHEWEAVASELSLLYELSQADAIYRPRRRDVTESLRKRLGLRGQRLMTLAEKRAELGADYVEPDEMELL
jgi:hypothetical protein